MHLVPPLPLVALGKVRDVYRLDDTRLLLVASDRISAFDVVLPTPIPGKGAALTRMSAFWFGKLNSAIPHHYLGTVEDQPDLPGAFADWLLLDDLDDSFAKRTMVCRRANIVPVECVVRGYLAGSAWKEYQTTQTVNGSPMPRDLWLADRLPEPLFTPTTKAAVGQHDEAISFKEMSERVGAELGEELRDRSLAIYKEAAEHAEACGLILADTKFEFGITPDGKLLLCDELLTCDSSRYWDADEWQPGREPLSFDKQFVRNYLQELCDRGRWNKAAPGPALPPDVIIGTLKKYEEAHRRLAAT